MKALITGGAGFIGSHLAELLLARRDEVVVIDDLSTGRIDNITPLMADPDFSYHIDSVMNRPLLAELVEHCDVVFHLAAAVGVRLIVDNPVRTIMTNISGTEAVLQTASKKKCKVLLTSTSEVYGKRTEVPFREDDDLVLGPPNKRRWSYACSKATDEFLALAYGEERQVPVVISRLFNTMGPRQSGRYGMVVPRFVEQALAGEPITVYGDGEQTRCFSYVGDVVRILAGLAELPAAVGEIINVGSTEEITIAQLAQRVKERTGSRSAITFVPYDEAYGSGFEDMRRRLPDTSKLSRLLSDRPTTSLDQALDAIIAHLRAVQQVTEQRAARARRTPARAV
jgi:UDP-glucose 4-epimerase